MSECPADSSAAARTPLKISDQVSVEKRWPCATSTAYKVSRAFMRTCMKKKKVYVYM